MAREPARTWHAQAALTDDRRALWSRGEGRTGWVHCGRQWDALSIQPLGLGLDALAALRLSTRGGYPVLADHLRGVLYVMVAPGTGKAAAGIPGVRVLALGNQLLVPHTAHGTPCAHWISAPHGCPPMVCVDRITAVLQHLTTTPAYDERAAS